MAAAPIATTNVIVVQAICNDPAFQQSSVSSFYWFASSVVGVTPITTQDVAAFFENLWAAPWQNLIYNGATYNGTRCRIVKPVSTDIWRFDNSMAAAGSGGAVGLPPQTCGLLKKFGDVIGKHGQGRTYLPFPSASGNGTDGLPNNAYIAAGAALGGIIDAIQTVTAGPNSTIIQPVLFDRTTGNTVGITAALTEGVWATQKRRGAFGRINKPPF
jgi:hypothetical protein